LVHFPGRKKRKRGGQRDARNGEEKDGEDEARAREERAEEEQGGGGAVARAAARGAGRGERGVLRPTPRSMLSSEVPVGGGCAEFPAARRRTPRVSSRCVPQPLLFLSLLLLLLLLSAYPGAERELEAGRLADRPTERGRRPVVRNDGPPSVEFSGSIEKLASGPAETRNAIAGIARRWSVADYGMTRTLIAISSVSRN